MTAGSQGRSAFRKIVLAWYVNVLVVALLPIVRGGGWDGAFGFALIALPSIAVGTFLIYEMRPNLVMSIFARIVASGLALLCFWGALYGIRYTSWFERLEWFAALAVALAIVIAAKVPSSKPPVGGDS